MAISGNDWDGGNPKYAFPTFIRHQFCLQLIHTATRIPLFLEEISRYKPVKHMTTEEKRLFKVSRLQGSKLSRDRFDRCHLSDNETAIFPATDAK